MAKKGQKGKAKKKAGGAKHKGQGSSLQAEQEAFLRQKDSEASVEIRSFVKAATEESMEEASPMLMFHSSARVEQVGRKDVDEIKGLGMVNRGQRLKAGVDVLVCEGLAFDDNLFAKASEESTSVLRKLGISVDTEEWSEEQWSLVVLDKLFREWRTWKKKTFDAFCGGKKVFESTGEEMGGGGLSYSEVWSVMFSDLYPRTADDMKHCHSRFVDKSSQLVDQFMASLEEEALADIHRFVPGACFTAAAHARARKEQREKEESNGKEDAKEEPTSEDKGKSGREAMTKEQVRQELVRLCLIVLFNSHGYHQHYIALRERGSDGSDEAAPPPPSRVQGIFPKGAFFNHSCWPNCDFFVLSATEDGMPDQLHVRTTRDVEIGEELTIAYIELLAPRTRRSLSLKEKYGFMCACSRCGEEGPAEALEADRLLAGLACRQDPMHCSGVLCVTTETNESGIMVCNGCKAAFDISANFKLPDLMKEMTRTLERLTVKYQEAMGLRDPRAREAKVLEILGEGETALNASREVFHSCHFLCILLTLRMAMFTKGLDAAATKAHHYLTTLLQAVVRVFPPGHFLHSMLFLDDAQVLKTMGENYQAKLALRKGKELLTITRGKAIACTTVERLAGAWFSA